MYPLNSPLSDEQIETWFSQDSTSAIKIAQELLGDTWGNLSDIRKRAVVDLSYNLGKARLAKFTAFLAAVKVGDFNAAGKELRNSAWFTQVGRRGPNIQTMIVQDVDPTRCNVKFPE
jgi:lysozyme